MCGDIEDDERLEGDPLLARFLTNARHLLGQQRPAGDADEGDELHHYLDRLFADALGRGLRDAQLADADAAYQRLAMQSVVFARLAGFIAGHVRLKEDPLRKLIEAAMLGYAEAEQHNLAERHQHGHEHAHPHEHGHHHPHPH